MTCSVLLSTPTSTTRPRDRRQREGPAEGTSAWLVLAVIAFNFIRAIGVLADHGVRLAKATNATIRRTLINVPARVTRFARRLHLYLPRGMAWPWESAFARALIATHAPPSAAIS